MADCKTCGERVIFVGLGASSEVRVTQQFRRQRLIQSFIAVQRRAGRCCWTELITERCSRHVVHINNLSLLPSVCRLSNHISSASSTTALPQTDTQTYTYTYTGLANLLRQDHGFQATRLLNGSQTINKVKH